MKISVLIAAVLALALSACGKHEEAPAAVVVTPAPAAAMAPAASAPVAVVVTSAPVAVEPAKK